MLAMSGGDCVAIAADRRFGVNQLQTVSTNFEKIFTITKNCLVGFQGLATDTQSLSAQLKAKVKLWELSEERNMPVSVVSHLIASSLYEKRFGPWFCEPVVAGLDSHGVPFISSFDLIGTESTARDFAVSGTASEQVYGVCESFWKEGLNEDELFEVAGQCLLAGVDRDCLSGWGAVIHVIGKDGVKTRYLKGRMD